MSTLGRGVGGALSKGVGLMKPLATGASHLAGGMPSDVMGLSRGLGRLPTSEAAGNSFRQLPLAAANHMPSWMYHLPAKDFSEMSSNISNTGVADRIPDAVTDQSMRTFGNQGWGDFVPQSYMPGMNKNAATANALARIAAAAKGMNPGGAAESLSPELKALSAKNNGRAAFMAANKGKLPGAVKDVMWKSPKQASVMPACFAREVFRIATRSPMEKKAFGALARGAGRLVAGGGKMLPAIGEGIGAAGRGIGRGIEAIGQAGSRMGEDLTEGISSMPNQFRAGRGGASFLSSTNRPGVVGSEFAREAVGPMGEGAHRPLNYVRPDYSSGSGVAPAGGYSGVTPGWEMAPVRGAGGGGGSGGGAGGGYWNYDGVGAGGPAGGASRGFTGTNGSGYFGRAKNYLSGFDPNSWQGRALYGPGAAGMAGEGNAALRGSTAMGRLGIAGAGVGGMALQHGANSFVEAQRRDRIRQMNRWQLGLGGLMGGPEGVIQSLHL